MGSEMCIRDRVGSVCELKPGRLTIVLGDAHIYENHVPALQEQLGQEMRKPPSLSLRHRPSIDAFCVEDFAVEHYEPHPAIGMPMSV